jgi:hypothetical protein
MSILQIAAAPRTAFIYLKQRTDLFDGKPKRMLHIAPEPSLGPVFQAIPNIDYISAEFGPQKRWSRWISQTSVFPTTLSM